MKQECLIENFLKLLERNDIESKNIKPMLNIPIIDLKDDNVKSMVISENLYKRITKNI